MLLFTNSAVSSEGKFFNDQHSTPSMALTQAQFTDFQKNYCLSTKQLCLKMIGLHIGSVLFMLFWLTLESLAYGLFMNAINNALQQLSGWFEENYQKKESVYMPDIMKRFEEKADVTILTISLTVFLSLNIIFGCLNGKFTTILTEELQKTMGEKLYIYLMNAKSQEIDTNSKIITVNILETSSRIAGLITSLSRLLEAVVQTCVSLGMLVGFVWVKQNNDTTKTFNLKRFWILLGILTIIIVQLLGYWLIINHIGVYRKQVQTANNHHYEKLVSAFDHFIETRSNNRLSKSYHTELYIKPKIIERNFLIITLGSIVIPFVFLLLMNLSFVEMLFTGGKIIFFMTMIIKIFKSLPTETYKQLDANLDFWRKFTYKTTGTIRIKQIEKIEFGNNFKCFSPEGKVLVANGKIPTIEQNNSQFLMAHINKLLRKIHSTNDKQKIKNYNLSIVSMIFEYIFYQKTSILVLQGKSGSGKSTIINALLGDLDSQDLFINNIPIKDIDIHSIYDRILVILPHSTISATESVKDYVFFGTGITKMTPKIMENLNVGFKAIGLYDVVHRDMKNTDNCDNNTCECISRILPMSVGQKDRIKLIRAYIWSVYNLVDLIIMDEPTAHLDSQNSEQARAFINHMNQTYGTMFLMAIHGPTEPFTVVNLTPPTTTDDHQETLTGV